MELPWNRPRNRPTTKHHWSQYIRVGPDYQADVGEFTPPSERDADQYHDRSILVWRPTPDIPDDTLNEYISKAYTVYGYNEEQALGLLFWHKHDIAKAIRDLDHFQPYPDEWDVEEEILFEQAHQLYGKNFRLIKQLFPEKTIGSLVRHYYLWKGTRSRKSLMDRQARKYTRRRGTWENSVGEGATEQESNWGSEINEVIL